MTQNTNLLGIHTAFAATEHGKTLASRVRYEKYKPADMTNEQWVALLGEDVGNLSHLTFTYKLAARFIEHSMKNQPELLKEDEDEILQVASLIHDWAEAFTGDISWGDKTDDHYEEEKAIFEQHLHEFYNGDADQLIDRARQEVIFNHDGGKLGEIFNAIERVGYLFTALRAYGHVQDNTAAGVADGLKWLFTDVLLNQTTALLKYAGQYKAVEDFLARRQDDITAAFQLADGERAIFKNYAENESAKTAQFDAALAAWNTQSGNLKVGDEPSIADLSS
jgi:hypothetical protein